MLPLASLIVVAVTADGRAAVTADSAGVTRLWPALDGTREPVVVAAPLATQLAIVREGDGFSIAACDDAGGLAIVGPAAAVHVRETRPILDVRAVAHGFVALRDDSAIDVIDVRGTVTATLVAEPGHHLDSLAVSADRALAIDTAAGITHGHWIELDGARPRWGSKSAELLVDPSHAVVLAPDGASIVGLDRSSKGGQHKLYRVDLASGRLIDTVDVNLADGGEPLGFVDAQSIAISYIDGVVIWRHHMLDPQPGGSVAAIGKDVIVGPRGEGLQLLRVDGHARYLGYTIEAASEVVADAAGWIVVAGDRVLRLDAQFSLRAVVRLPRGQSSLHLLDARRAVAASPDPFEARVMMYDLDAPAHMTRLRTSVGPASDLFDVDRATGRIAYGDSHHIVFARYDARAGAPVTQSELAEGDKQIDGGYFGVRLLDPAHDGGRHAVVLASVHDGNFLRFLPVTGVDPLRTEVATERRIDRARAVDEFFAALKIRRTLRVPSPDGRLVAELDSERLSLSTSAGVLRWSVAVHGAQDLAWSSTGELVVAGGGLARVDLATGALVGVHGAWRFGLVDSDADLAEPGSLGSQ
jgi:hypothetical protein